MSVTGTPVGAALPAGRPEGWRLWAVHPGVPPLQRPMRMRSSIVEVLDELQQLDLSGRRMHLVVDRNVAG